MGNVKVSEWTAKDILVKYGVYLILVVLMVVFSFVNKKFLTFDNFMLMLQQLAPFGIAVIGMTFVLITAGIDISVGRIMFISGVMVGEVLTRLPAQVAESPFVIVICTVIVMAVGAAFGLANGLLITKMKIYPFIATLIMGYIARGLGLSIAGITKYDVSVLGKVTNARIGGVPVAFIIFILLAAGMNFVLRNTKFGRHTMAIGNNPHAAEQIGINVTRHKIIIYVLCGVFAAVGGMFSAGQISEVFTTFGENNEFQIISATVIGGTSLFGGRGTILPGAIFGVLLIQVVLNGLSMMNASVYVFNIVRGVIIFIAVALDCINYKGELR